MANLKSSTIWGNLLIKGKALIGGNEVYHAGNLGNIRTVTSATTVALTDHFGCIVVDAANVDITIPDNLPVGFHFKVLKVSSYDTNNTNSVDLLTSGNEVATVAQLTTIPLYGNGSNWTLEKVSSVRWEIVTGWDVGENSNGRWSRDSGGWQENELILLDLTVSAGAASDVLVDMPMPFVDTSYKIVSQSSAGTSPARFSPFANNKSTASVRIGAWNFTSTGATASIDAVIRGRWYELA